MLNKEASNHMNNFSQGYATSLNSLILHVN
jgi:hypothetical protein